MRAYRLMTALAGMALAGWSLGSSALAAERLQVPEVVGWKQISGVAERAGETNELIPETETPDTWTRRISIQAFRGVPLSVSDFLNQVAERTAPVCEGATAGPSSLGTVSGMPAGTRTVACGKYKGDGKGTFALHYVIRGREALYVISRYWRGAPFDPSRMPISQMELDEWTNYVNSVELCDSSGQGRPCR